MQNTGERSLLAGYAEVNITPPLGTNIPGYFSKRSSMGIITELHARAIAFFNGEEKALFLSCEALKIFTDGYLEVREKIAKRCDISPDLIYISCNHSHTACSITAEDFGDDMDKIFTKILHQKMCDCAQFAFEDLKPATMKMAKGEAKGVGFMRRYRMKNGKVKTNPGLGNPEIDHFEGEQDNSLQLIRIIREDAKEILLVNFGTHPDVISGKKYCADYPGYMIETIKGAFGNDVEVLFFNGAQGDSNHVNAFLPGDPDKKVIVPMGVHLSKRMGRILAGEVLKIYDDATPLEGSEIKGAYKELQIAKAPHKPDDVPIAREISRIYHEKGKKAPELSNYTMGVPEALRILRNLNVPDFYTMSIYAIRIGELVFAGIPGEPFQKIGTDIKDNSKFKITFVTCCTNGNYGYFPTEEAFAVDGYERATSNFAPNCAKIITDGMLNLLDEMK